MDPPAVHLDPKSSNMPDQLPFSQPRVLEQQNLPQSNIPPEQQLPFTHPRHSLPLPPNPLVNPQFFFPTHE